MKEFLQLAPSWSLGACLILGLLLSWLARLVVQLDKKYADLHGLWEACEHRETSYKLGQQRDKMEIKALKAEVTKLRTAVAALEALREEIQDWLKADRRVGFTQPLIEKIAKKARTRKKPA